MTEKQSYLETFLSPLAAYLVEPDITDLYINRPGEVWIERLGIDPIRCLAPDLTATLLDRLARQIAALSAQGINRAQPLLSASLPSGERVQIIMPPATRRHIALAIRRHIVSEFSLEDYRAAGAFVHPLVGDDQTQVASSLACDEPDDEVRSLKDAVKGRRNILISGGTSSGKTTFLNALLREIPSNERLIFIEDTPELRIFHENAVGLIAARGQSSESNVSVDDLLVAALRMRPDRLILGEIRGAEAGTFLRSVNTGHPGSLSTIHADSPERAIEQLALLVMQTGTRMTWDDVVRYIKASLDLVIQLDRRGGTRRVTHIETY